MSFPSGTRLAGFSKSTLVHELRHFAARGLARLYRPHDGVFAFRIRRVHGRLLLEGTSVRYTAIALIGLAGEDGDLQRSVLGGIGADEVCTRLLRDVSSLESLGEVALLLWAACATGCAERRPVTERLLALEPDRRTYPTIEIAWALAALCADDETTAESLRHRLARRLLESFDPGAGTFPHDVGAIGGGLRNHVSCFADLVYPTHALARYTSLYGDREARDVALQCAQDTCARQGPNGQWWWHYDMRNGHVIEPYPVYAIHQDAMAPMALFAVEEATGVSFDAKVRLSLDWLASAPELNGGSLIDRSTDLIWRKVARREPRKLARYIQATASRLHRKLRVPGLDLFFPPCAVDYEDRPYHLGWLLYAWPTARVSRWEKVAV